MFKSEELSVIQTVRPVYRGQELQELPSHMELLPWFNTEYHNKELIHRELLRLGDYAIGRAIGTQRSLHIQDAPYVACDLDVNGDVVFREMLLSFVKDLDVDFEDEKALNDWVPHIGDTEDLELVPGDEVEFKSLALISRNVGKKVVEASYYISKHEETAA